MSRVICCSANELYVDSSLEKGGACSKTEEVNTYLCLTGLRTCACFAATAQFK